MPEIRPFRAIHFDPNRVGGDLGPVLSPPYDVVDGEYAKRLESQHPFNSVRLELCIPPAEPEPERYRRAAETWISWRRDGVLLQDREPSLYVYRHSFLHCGRRTVRTALVGLMGEGAMPHEETMAGPKRDRLDLLHACRAQFSPILALYEDPEGKVRSRMTAAMSERAPDLAARFGDEEISVWRLDDREVVAAISADLASYRVVIADGHHRYESVGRFIRENAGKRHTGVLAALVSTEDPGLVVLPTHRLVRAPGCAGVLLEALSNALNVKARPASLAAFDDAGTTLIASTREGSWELATDQDAASVLETLDRVLGRTEGAAVEYVRDAASALHRVAVGEAEIVFLVPGLSSEEVFRKACQGYLFPRKTTYFHPKVPAGLLMCDL